MKMYIALTALAFIFACIGQTQLAHNDIILDTPAYKLVGNLYEA
jgi:hypothetical protein